MRYLLEFLQDCYPSRLQEQIGEMKKLQDHLGAISDCRATTRILQETGLSELPEASHLKRDLDRNSPRTHTGLHRPLEEDSWSQGGADSLGRSSCRSKGVKCVREQKRWQSRLCISDWNPTRPSVFSR